MIHASHWLAAASLTTVFALLASGTLRVRQLLDHGPFALTAEHRGSSEQRTSGTVFIKTPVSPEPSPSPGVHARLMDVMWVGDGAKWWGDASMWASLQVRLTPAGIATLSADGGMVLEHRVISWQINDCADDSVHADQIEGWYANNVDASGNADYVLRMRDGTPSLYFAVAQLRVSQLMAYPGDDPRAELETYHPQIAFTQGRVKVDVDYYLLTARSVRELGLNALRKDTPHSITWPESEHLCHPVVPVDAAAVRASALDVSGTQITFAWDYCSGSDVRTTEHSPALPSGPQRPESHGW